jgi:protein dithiol oxidoreductase (disulfide-forming)
MISRKAFLNAFLALLASSAAVPLHAAITQGRDYSVLPTPQRPDAPGKIEVIEFFSYGCPHCYELEPLIASWKKKLPPDVAFKRVAVAFGRPMWDSLGRTYYAFSDMNVLAKLDNAIFDAVHRQRLPLQDEKSITAWVGKQGIDPAKFSTAYKSFSVNTRMSQGERMVEAYQVSGVPQIVVAGKYVANGQSYDEMLRIASELVDKARAEKK